MHRPRSTSVALDWDTILISGGSAVLAAVLAVVATLVGNRHTHVLRVRHEHHDDLRKNVLEPWRERVEVLRNSLTPSLLRVWVVATARGFDVRSPLARREDPFPPSPLLWSRAKEHWPDTREEWREVQRLEKELADGITRLLPTLDKDPVQAVARWEALATGAATDPAASELLAKAAGLRARTTRFLDSLERLIYDRNLEGHCEFCPREPGMARAFRSVVE